MTSTDLTAVSTSVVREPLERPRVVSVGMSLVCVAVGVWFATLLGVYLLARSAVLSAGDEWLGGVDVPLQTSNVMLATLCSSAVIAHWAHWAVVRNDRRHAYLALFLLLVFGAAYINATSWQYQQMGLVAAESLAGLLVYVITGSHLVLTVVGMLAVFVTAFRALAGQYKADQHDGVLATVVLWDVVVATFVLVWFAVYITK
ncbi:MAG: hypothetical protein KatS3mg008_1495 [Acidimicrobiales bacterium]|nr:MAG: hypothetical protein KatS3mg008_1495 [Acidimicrobiales bacterium]